MSAVYAALARSEGLTQSEIERIASQELQGGKVPEELWKVINKVV
jgi:uncharacterized protein YdbL (DUF1318 family)